jgi:RNA polymerase sigma factor (sigma-70 family)
MGDDAVLTTAFDPALSSPDHAPGGATRPCALDAGAAGPALVEAHLCTIQEAVRRTARRYRLTGDDAGELLSRVVIRLLERDAAALRTFRGDSSLLTFLTSVARRLLLDHWIAERGRWRPSADARRLGRVAICLERLVYRDGLPLSQCGATIHERFGVAYTEEELAFMLSLLPLRQARSFIPHDGLDLPASDLDPLERLLVQMSRPRGAGLARALDLLDPEERLLVRLRFHDGLTVARIAETRGMDQRRLYARFVRITKRLRALMERPALCA